MKDRKFRQQALHDTLASRIVVMDSAMGSILQSQLTVADYGGSHLENCTGSVCRTRPDLIAAIHKQYLDAGARIRIESDSFNGHPLSMAEFQLQDATVEINHAAARIAREAAGMNTGPMRSHTHHSLNGTHYAFHHGHTQCFL